MGTGSAPRGNAGHVRGARHKRSRLLALLVVVAAGMFLPASAQASYKVSLTRTTGGVANISGQNFGDVGYGVGYAQAQDGICLLAETFLTVDGERSAFFGPNGTFKNEAEGGVGFFNPNPDNYSPALNNNRVGQK